MGLALPAFFAGLLAGRFVPMMAAAVTAGAPLRQMLAYRSRCECPPRRRDWLPVVWWLRNRGRCPRCGSTVEVTYPLAEMVTAGVFAGTAYFVGPAWSLPAFFWFATVTVVVGLVDLGHRLIPNRILLPGTAIGLLLLLGGAALDERLGDVPEAVASGAGYFALLLIPALLTGGAIGMGDVKLAFLLGLFAGYGGWEVTLLAGMGAFVLAGAVVVLLLVFRVVARNDHIPFGPFMVLAAWIAIARDLAVLVGTG